MDPPGEWLAFYQGKDYTWRPLVVGVRVGRNAAFNTRILPTIYGFLESLQELGGVSFLLILESLAMVVKTGF